MGSNSIGLRVLLSDLQGDYFGVKFFNELKQKRQMERQFPITISISPSVHNEWMRKEEGSYQDHGKPGSGHIFNLLCDNWKKGKLTINTQQELDLLKTSADYQTSWGDGVSQVVERLMKKAEEIVNMMV